MSKLTLPMSGIDHYCVSLDGKYVALSSRIDRMVVVVDVGRCMGSE